MFERIYVEIGNICNLSCSFCHGTKRPPRQMTVSEFAEICEKIKGRTRFIYLHVMGEPLVHKELPQFLEIAKRAGLAVCITTNGTRLSQMGDELIEKASVLHKVSVSLHAPEGSGISQSLDEYLRSVSDFAKSAAASGIYTVFRLWNENSREGVGKNRENERIEGFLRAEFSGEWQKRPRGYRLAQNIFLEYDGVFTWPASSSAEEVCELFCYGLSSQLAILADGTVTPCCLDCEGDIPLGNIFESSLEDIISSNTAALIKDGFRKGRAVAPLCKKCTFARKFKLRRN